MADARPGFLLTLEGVEGSGKSTLADSLEDKIRGLGLEVIRTREPGGTSLSEAVRSVVLDASHGQVSPWAELFLMLAARAQLVQELVEPALSRGAVVLCDRFLDASAAYQGAGRELGIDEVNRLNRIATQGIWPDLTLLLDLDPSVGRGRQAHAPDRMERERLDFHGRVRDGYRQIAKAEPERVFLIDASATPAEVLEKAWDRLISCRSDLFRH